MPKREGPPRTEKEKKHAREADAEALALFNVIDPMDRVPMERYLRKNPPSIAVVAAIAWVAIEEERRRNGLAGATKRHKSLADLKAWTIEQYKAGRWRSANSAGHALRDSVIAHGRTLKPEARLSEENAQRTIAEWIRKSV